MLTIENRVFAGEPPWSREQFWAELALVPGRRCYLVADAAPPTSSGVAGYAGVAWSADSAEVMTLAVDPSAQGTGLGRQLLEGLLERAQQRRAPEVLLEVRADNVAARALYERLAFETVSRRRSYYRGGVDGLVMRRRAASGTSRGMR